MRYQVLLRSVQRRLDEGETVHHAAFMWQRHRWMAGYALAAFAALFLVATVAGFQTWFARAGVGMAGAAVAANATTSYFVLARSNRGLVLLRASKIRQYAVEVLERLGTDTALERVGGTMLANDWTVGTEQFTVAKSSEGAMTAMATATAQNEQH